ncbi:hypothetical protein [Metabacillus fastidiosus]|uniref:hypothetical protein n=1 Tax=Metabacillus fastidiosus TaxID=1458 RepID=UPI002E1D5841|nr:hypothetical protein [Metabacillus fastidiosus]
MAEIIYDKNEHVERDPEAEKEEIELAYKKLCEFEQSYFEVIYKDSSGNIVYEIDPTKLAELENIPEINLKDYDYNTGEFPSYEKLFESKYKQKFLKNIAAIEPKEIEKKLGRETLDQTARRDPELKEKDLDNDGVPDRIDINDNMNSIQTVADLNIVKNTTSKEIGIDQEKGKSRQNDETEL